MCIRDRHVAVRALELGHERLLGLTVAELAKRLGRGTAHMPVGVAQRQHKGKLGSHVAALAESTGRLLPYLGRYVAERAQDQILLSEPDQSTQGFDPRIDSRR